MVFISANLGRRKWIPCLRRKQLDPEEVAADLLLFLYRKTPRFRLKVELCQVFLQALNTAIYRFLVSLVRKGNAVPLVVSASQCGEDEDEGLGMLEVPAPDEVSIQRLSHFLRETEDCNLRDIPGDIFDLVKCYRLLCRAVVRFNTMTPWAKLPGHLRRRITLEQHALIAYRINRTIFDYATSPDPGSDDYEISSGRGGHCLGDGV